MLNLKITAALNVYMSRLCKVEVQTFTFCYPLFASVKYRLGAVKTKCFVDVNYCRKLPPTSYRMYLNISFFYKIMLNISDDTMQDFPFVTSC